VRRLALASGREPRDLWVFHADASLFRSGWFVESLATQSLVVFVIRTRRVPFFHPPEQTAATHNGAVAAIGVILPFSPLASTLGFRPLPLLFLAILLAMTATYLGLVEAGKAIFYAHSRRRPA